jgi:hypothetical protein
MDVQRRCRTIGRSTSMRRLPTPEPCGVNRLRIAGTQKIQRAYAGATVLRPAVLQCRRTTAAATEPSLELDATPRIVYANNRLNLARVSASLVL